MKRQSGKIPPVELRVKKNWDLNNYFEEGEFYPEFPMMDEDDQDDEEEGY